MHGSKTACDTYQSTWNDLGIDEVSLARLRKQFAAGYRGLTWDERLHLVDVGLNGRLAYVHREMALYLTEAQLEAWWRYLEHDQRDMTEMEQGLYPIGAMLIRRYCALLRMERGFLLLGTDPTQRDRGLGLSDFGR